MSNPAPLRLPRFRRIRFALPCWLGLGIVSLLAARLGDRVEDWMTMNEPQS